MVLEALFLKVRLGCTAGMKAVGFDAFRLQPSCEFEGLRNYVCRWKKLGMAGQRKDEGRRALRRGGKRMRFTGGCEVQ